MGLVVTVTDRYDQDIGELTDHLDILHRLLSPADDEAFPLLRLIDLYGYTTFGHHQASPLLKELHRLRDLASTYEEQCLLDGIISLASQVAESVQLYLRFKGA